MRFSHFLFILYAIFGVLIGVSVIAKKSDEKCTAADEVDVSSCKLLAQEYIEKVKQLSKSDLKSTSQMKDFQNTCRPINQCLSSLSHCDIFGNGQTELFMNTVKTFCDLIYYLHNSPCSEKLEFHDSKCFKDWNPFLQKNEANDENKKKTACKNYFGSNGCMRREMTEMCGREEWIKFRALLINLNNLVFKQCDLRIIVWN